jgi:hypothetical protein
MGTFAIFPVSYRLAHHYREGLSASLVRYIFHNLRDCSGIHI